MDHNKPGKSPQLKAANILLVDDQRANLLVLRALLEDLGHNLVEARSGEEALQLLAKDEFAAILLDVQMPGLDGFETAKLIRSGSRSLHTPIIFVTGFDDGQFSVDEAYSLGAVDYLLKPISSVILRAKINNFVQLFQNQQRTKHEAEQLRMLIHGTNEYAIFMLDADGHIITWNPGAERLKGYRAEEIVGQHFSRFYEQEAIDRGWPAFELKTARSEGRFEDEGWRLRKDGTKFWANVVITALHDEAGDLRGFSKITRDMTEKKQAQENEKRLLQEETARQVAEEHAKVVHEERERLRVTLASIGDAVISTDAEGRITFLNSVAEDLTGWTTSEATGVYLVDVFKIVNEETRQPVENPALRALKEGAVVGLANHTILIAKDGTERPIDDSAAPIKDSSGIIIGVILIFRDVTEQRRAASAVRESDARKTAILETALDCIITMDHEGRIIEFNPAAEKTFGRNRADVIGRPLADLIIPPRLRDRHWSGLAHYLKTGEGPVLDKRIELPGLCSDGKEIPLELSITRLPISGPPIFTAYIRDTSERTRTEAHRNTRLAVTEAVAQASNTEEAASGVIEAVCKSLGWDVGMFWIVDREADALRFLKSWHRPEADTSEFENISRRYSFKRGEGLPGRVWGNARAAWILDVVDDSNFPRAAAALNEELHGAFACPLIVGNKVLGVIEFFSHEIREPDADLLEMMGTIAGQIAQFVERIQAEENLRQSEQELADFFENATVGLHWAGPDGTILRANRAELELLGYRAEEYVGRKITDFHVDEEVICDILKRLQEGEKLNDYPARLRCKNGSIKDVLIDSSVLWKAGEFIHTRCFTRNVTDRKRVEEEVRFQARLLDTVGQAAIVTQPDGTIIYWNQFAETLYGWSKDDALGRNIVQVVAAPAAVEQAAEILEQLRSGKSWSGEFLVRRRDGTTFTALVTDTPVFDDQGNIKAIVGISVDISDRKRTEHALRFLADASAKLGFLVDYHSTLQTVAGLAVPKFADWCAVDLVDSDGTAQRLAVVHVDPEKVKLAHEFYRRYPPNPNDSHGLPQVLRTGEPDMMTDIPDELLVQGAKDEEHLHALRQLGLRSYMCVPLKGRGKLIGVITFVSAESGRRYTIEDLAFAEELARRAGIAIENAQLYAELREADRRKDEFLATLAHELRNPLAPIRNALQILKMPRIDPETGQNIREVMERQVDQLVRLVDDLLDASRVMRGKIELRKESVELASIVARAVETAKPLIEVQGHELNIRLPTESMLLDADPVRLGQVVGNVLTNAAKYTEAGGHIWLTAHREGESVELRVRDDGIGIAPEVLPSIFDLFVQADHAATRSQGGLGIGLTLVKNLVEMHGGSVEVHSAGLGKGSEFVIRLPLAKVDCRPPDIHEAGNKNQVEAQLLSGHRLLVVDDNEDAANSLAMLLRIKGHDVQVAHHGLGAIEIASRFRPEMIFLDIGMPGMDGYEVARRIRELPDLKDTVLAALTGWGQQEDRRRTTEAGFDHHLVKPPEPREVEGLLAKLKT